MGEWQDAQEQLTTDYSQTLLDGKDSRTGVRMQTLDESDSTWFGNRQASVFGISKHLQVIAPFSVYQDSANVGLKCAVKGGDILWHGAINTVADTLGLALTASVNNYVYLDMLTMTPKVATGSFPDDGIAPHVRLAVLSPNGTKWRIDTQHTEWRNLHVLSPAMRAIPHCVKHRVSFNDSGIYVGNLAAWKILQNLPARAQIMDAVAEVVTPFAGGGATSVLTSLGSNESFLNVENAFIDAVDVMAAAGTIYRDTADHGVELKTLGRSAGPYSSNATTAIRVKLLSDVFLNTLTAGAVDIWVMYRVL